MHLPALFLLSLPALSLAGELRIGKACRCADSNPLTASRGLFSAPEANTNLKADLDKATVGICSALHADAEAKWDANLNTKTEGTMHEYMLWNAGPYHAMATLDKNGKISYVEGKKDEEVLYACFADIKDDFEVLMRDGCEGKGMAVACNRVGYFKWFS